MPRLRPRAFLGRKLQQFVERAALLVGGVNCRFSNFSQTSAPMISESVRLTSIGVRMTAPSMRFAAAWMSSIEGGCMLDACNMAEIASPSARLEQC
jgi:hypothetical protein